MDFSTVTTKIFTDGIGKTYTLSYDPTYNCGGPKSPVLFSTNYSPVGCALMSPIFKEYVACPQYNKSYLMAVNVPSYGITGILQLVLPSEIEPSCTFPIEPVFKIISLDKLVLEEATYFNCRTTNVTSTPGFNTGVNYLIYRKDYPYDAITILWSMKLRCDLCTTCPSNFVCLSNGECVSEQIPEPEPVPVPEPEPEPVPEPPIVPEPEQPCPVECGGLCYGICPEGSKCYPAASGNYECISPEETPIWIEWWFWLAIIAGIIIIIIVGVVVGKKTHPVTVTPKKPSVPITPKKTPAQ